MEHSIVASGLNFPERPVALADGSLLVVEIGGGVLTQILPDGSKRCVAETGGGPNGAAVGPDGLIYLCNNGGFEWATNEQGEKHLLDADEFSLDSAEW